MFIFMFITFMKKIRSRIFLIFIISSSAYSEGILNFKIPIGQKIKTGPRSPGSPESIDGSVLIDLARPTKSQNPPIIITKDFYGADAHGFSILPPSSLVSPLNLNYVKLGGSLHATYNWEFNAYYNNQEIHYAYAPLIDRLEMIQKHYKAQAMFEVNMLGLQPDIDASGMLILKNTADAVHAGNAIRFLNGKNKMGLKHIMMGNEPFESEEYNDIHIPSADEYIEKFINYAMALREAQEEASGNPNDIKLWGPELNTGWTGWQTNNFPDCLIDYEQLEKIKCSYGNGEFHDFIPYFLSRLMAFEKDKIRNPKGYKMLDFLTIHYYPLFRTNFSDPTSIIQNQKGNQNIEAMLESVNLWDNPTYINHYDAASIKKIPPNIIKKFKNWTQQYYPNVKMGLTEFGIDSVDKIKYHPIVRPLYLADFVARVGAAGLDVLINSFLQGGRDSNSWAMIDRKFKTNIYYMYSLFTNYFLGEVLTVSDSFGDAVNAYAVKNGEGINVFLINKEKKNKTLALQLKKVMNSADGIEEALLEMQLPPWSLSVLLIPNRSSGGEISVHQYGAREMGIAVGP